MSVEPVPARRGRRPVALAATVAGLGGFLFGYHTGVIAVALLSIPGDLGPLVAGRRELSDGTVSLIVASLVLGAIAGAVGGGPLADRIGRRATLILVSVMFIAGALGSASAGSVAVLVAARVGLGVAIGVSSVTVPMYIAEIAPPRRRGSLVSLYQLFITVGIVVSYLVGFAWSDVAGWRWMLGLAAIPGLLMLVGLLTVAESPRWLVLHGHQQRAREILLTTRTAEQVETEIYDITEDAKAEAGRTWRDVFAPGMRPALTLGIGIAALNQLVGVNAVLYYAPTILVGLLGEPGALLATIGIGSVNMVVTLVVILGIDRWGRRPLLIGGVAIVTLALFALGGLYLLTSRPGWVGAAVVIGLCVYIAGFAASLGLGLWLVNSEVYPTAIRRRAASLGSVVHWGLNLVIASSVLTLIATIGPTGLFWAFGLVGVGGVVFLVKLMPETRGRSLEQVDHALRQAQPGDTEPGQASR